jgi:hypothetical protein
MNDSKKPTRRDAVNLPLAEDEIEISSGTLAEAPRRIHEKKAVTSLRVITRQTREFEKRVSEEQSKLDAARSLAIQIQEQYEFMIEQRSGLLSRIGSAENELAVSQKRMTELENFIQYNFSDMPQFEQIGEFFRRQFMVAHIPKWISDWRGPLTELNQKISAFEQQHGIGENQVSPELPS